MLTVAHENRYTPMAENCQIDWTSLRQKKNNKFHRKKETNE